jgi:hypothetical protein
MEITLKLDEKSKNILEKVEGFHRTSLINYAIRLLEKSEVYKVISGEVEAKTIDSTGSVDDLEIINEEPKVEKTEKKKPKMAIDW